MTAQAVAQAATGAAGEAAAPAEGQAVVAEKTREVIVTYFGQLDSDPTLIIEKIEKWINGSYTLLPNIIVALIFFGIFWGVAKAVEASFVKWAARRKRKNLGEVLGGFLRWAVTIFGFFIAITIILPSVEPVDLLAGLGIGSVAIGFAFKDILQNWLAGLLILFRQPFLAGDQIVISGYEGTVERIETRSTNIRTHDGRLVLVPNSDAYTNAVTVATAFKKRQSQCNLAVPAGADIAKTRELIVTTLGKIDGVLQDPAPAVLTTDLQAAKVILQASWWTGSKYAEITSVRSQALEALKAALEKNDFALA
ncbi:mechanosensitive ion channel family protein [Microbaculum marinisediminis]|uniref:Small-conductance mechanosensitive channel n=1 Tax=Microbaculum marinisediminis TaxID=2931392 RepID=A0AAW5QUQ4_9HYPH|nr:mechanosensitive ion channel family protein [Microbaculum sp. A6E488]MCT8970634.1 mechanosensitive ion channel family protein [Microbaculum sp. A6E488]